MSNYTSKPTTQNSAKSRKDPTNKTYATIWRWHFYTGLFIAPFLIILALTGLGMLLFANIDGRHGELISVNTQGESSIQPLSQHVNSVQKYLPSGEVTQYISPKSDDTAAIFKVVDGETTTMVAIDPYTSEVITSYPKSQGLYDLMDNIHGDLLIGKTGDYLLETAASLTILMILSGWYLWWSRQKSMRQSLVPDLKYSKKGKNTKWWRNSHGATGAWISVFLFLFLLSGLAWSGIWGSKMVQAWNQFPDNKWSKPESTLIEDLTPKITHGEALNDTGPKDVPWVLEQTPMPHSDSTKTIPQDSHFVPLTDGMVTLENLDYFAENHTVQGRYQLNFPKGEKGVWTISQDSMSYDSSSPTADRTIHIDQYSGAVLADIKYDDYNVIGKFMAVGIALHMGTLGLWSIVANVLFCLAVIFMCLGSLMMWWKRRPNGSRGLVPPPKRQTNIGMGFGLLLFITAVCFPLALVAIVAILLLDFLLLSRIPKLDAWFHG